MAMVNILLDSSHTQQSYPDSFSLSVFQQHYKRMVLVHNPLGPQLVVPVNASVHIPHGRPPCVFLISLLGIIRIRITYTSRRHSWATHDITTICLLLLLQVEKCGGRLAVTGRDSVLTVDEILFLSTVAGTRPGCCMRHCSQP
jgi:hypothetical protein